MQKDKEPKWEPQNFKPEVNSIWSFPIRGDWATHDSKYRGNWSPYVPRNVILRYSNVGDVVLDQFVGGGTTLVEAKLLNRNSIGVDINSNALSRCKEKCNFDRDECGKVYIRRGNAQRLSFIKDSSIDLICTHPPYSNIIKYSDGLDGDISLLNIDDYFKSMQDVATESHRVLRKGKFCAILVGDIRKNGSVIPIGFQVMLAFQNAGFLLKEVIIKEQHNCSSTEYWINKSVDQNFFLLAHEYLFVFKKIR